MTISSGQQALAADILKHATADGYLRLTASTEVTIASGAVTVTANFYRVDTEGDASSDDLDTITAGAGVADGHLLILRAENDARTVVIKHNTGNILLAGSADVLLDDAHDTVFLIYDGNKTKWIEITPGGNVRHVGHQYDTYWDAGGTTNRFVAGVNIQSGAITVTCTSGQSHATAGVTLPKSYPTEGPLVIATLQNSNISSSNKCIVAAYSSAGVPPIGSISIEVYPVASTFPSTFTATINWITIGRE